MNKHIFIFESKQRFGCGTVLYINSSKGATLQVKTQRNTVTTLNPIQDKLFRGCLGMGVKRSPLKCLSHISHNGKTWHSFTLPTGDPKNVYTPLILLTSAFFIG